MVWKRGIDTGTCILNKTAGTRDLDSCKVPVAIVSTGQGKQAYNCISNPLIINIIRFGIFSKVVLFSYSRTFLKNEMQCMLLTMRFNFEIWDI